MDSAAISFPIFGEGFTLDLPTYLSVFGLNIYIYGLLITAGFVLAAVYLYKRHDALGLSGDNVLDLVIMAVPFGIIGARIYYAVFNASYYFGAGNWLNIFKLREGGLAVYGGVIGGAIAFFIYGRIKKIKYGKLVDAAGFGLFLGQALGRWGNFINREAFGTETDLPWRMGFTTPSGADGVLQTVYVHPTFIYESLWNIAGFVILHILSKKLPRKYYGQYFLFYVAWYGLGRFMIEGLRTDSLYIASTGIRASQLLAAMSFFAAVAIMIINHKHPFLAPVDELPAEAAGDEDAEGEVSDEDTGEEKDEGTEQVKAQDENSDEASDTSADEGAVDVTESDDAT